MSKVCAACTHFLQIADIATSRKFGDLLLNPIEVVHIYRLLSHQSPKVVINSESLKDILIAAGCSEEELKSQDIARYLDHLSLSSKKRSLGEKAINCLTGMILTSKFSLDQSFPVHCASTVLSYIHNCSAVPYVGVSKRLCSLCHFYFDAYHQVMSPPVPIKTRSQHAKTPDWIYPTIVSDEGIKQAFCRNLLREIRAVWNERYSTLSAPPASGGVRLSFSIENRASSLSVGSARR